MKHQPEAAASYLFVEIDQPSDDHHGVAGQLEPGGWEESEVEVSTPGRTLETGGSCDGVLGDPIPTTPHYSLSSITLWSCRGLGGD